MGMFSYICTKCGPKEQFDWMDACVVKLVKFAKKKKDEKKTQDDNDEKKTLNDNGDDDIYVRGQYDGYGHVKVAVQGQEELALVLPPSNLQVPFWEDGQLVATAIFCNGNFSNGGDAADMTNLMHTMAKEHGNFFKAMAAGGRNFNMDDYDSDSEEEEEQQIRICVPKDVTVLNELTKEQFTHAVAVSAKAVTYHRNKRREKNEATDKKKKKKAPPTPTTTAGEDGGDNDDDETQNKKPKASGTPDQTTTTTTTSSAAHWIWILHAFRILSYSLEEMDEFERDAYRW